MTEHVGPVIKRRGRKARQIIIHSHHREEPDADKIVRAVLAMLDERKRKVQDDQDKDVPAA